MLRDLFCQDSGPAWRDFKRLVNISLKAERYRSIRGIGKTSVSDTHSKAIDLIELQDSFTRTHVRITSQVRQCLQWSLINEL